MNWLFILLLLALIVAGYYVYQRLLALEREIRAAGPGPAERTESSVAPLGGVSEESEPQPVTAGAAMVTPEAGLDNRILAVLAEAPGLAQTELYLEFPDAERRVLQKLLRRLEDSGRLRREKKGSSYRLYPL